ncbi:serine/threonine-protein kinase [Streptomyces sp. NPDC048172]|uniref:serine/threonine-protein kinase n=1 Tax=Streptomyces sp. NPDC048172 TaxID=3365505 RepID=UPI003713304F
MRELEPGEPRIIGEYRLLGCLGEGGMGRVYLARSSRGRTVAVKVVQPELARVPEFRERFRREVGLAQRLTGQWAASVLDSDTESPAPWAATEYVPGPSLHSVVTSGFGTLPAESLRGLAHGLGLALHEVHGIGLVHRDVKPGNVLVTVDGPRLIDFGIARAVEATSGGDLTRTGTVVGSPGFMSPEQVRAERVGPVSDIFSLGCVLAFAASGSSPFGSSDIGQAGLLFRVVEHEPDLSAVPGEWRPLVAACLEKAPERRPTVAQIVEWTAPRQGPHGAPDAGPWLPAPVLADLGRHAARMLDSESPAGATLLPGAPAAAVPHAVPHAVSDAAPTTPPVAPTAPPSASPSAAPTAPPTGATPPPASPPSPPPRAQASGGRSAASLRQQASAGRPVIRVASWRDSTKRFAELAQLGEQLGYVYDAFTVDYSSGPTLILRHASGQESSRTVVTPFEQLRSRVTVDGMGTYLRSLILVALGTSQLAVMASKGVSVGSLFVLALTLGIGYVVMRGNERKHRARLVSYGYRLLPDASGRQRYLPPAHAGPGPGPGPGGRG